MNIKDAHTRFASANALVQSAMEKGQVTAQRSRLTGGGNTLSQNTIVEADTSAMTPDQITALRNAIKVANAGHAAQTVLNFKFGWLADAQATIDRLEARVKVLEGGESPSGDETEHATAKRAKRATANAGQS